MAADQVVVQYRFTDPVTGFSDAIVLPLDEFKATFGDLDAIDVAAVAQVKAERVANWQTALEDAKNAPPPDPKVEAQELADRVAALSADLAVLEADLAVKVEALPPKDRPKVVEVVEVEAVEGK